MFRTGRNLTHVGFVHCLKSAMETPLYQKQRYIVGNDDSECGNRDTHDADSRKVWFHKLADIAKASKDLICNYMYIRGKYIHCWECSVQSRCHVSPRLFLRRHITMTRTWIYHYAPESNWPVNLVQSTGRYSCQLAIYLS